MGLIGGCGSATSTVELQLVVADQTVENPIKDVIEIDVGDEGPLYPDSAAGGSPTSAGSWTAGAPLLLRLWANATEESSIEWSFTLPDQADEASIVTVVLEIEDDQVIVSSSALGLREEYARQNLVAQAREDEEEAAEEAAKASADETRALVLRVQLEAADHSTEISDMQGRLQNVLDEHGEVYGDDDWATFPEISRMYRDYTTDALAELAALLPVSSFDTPQVANLNAEWHAWWQAYFDMHSRSETAARNNDSTAMDAARAAENELWLTWDRILDRSSELQSLSIDDLSRF
jgi:hypothetical protein